MRRGRWAAWGVLALACVGLPLAGAAHALPRLSRVMAYTSETMSPAARAAIGGDFRWASAEELRTARARAGGKCVEMTHTRVRAPGKIVRVHEPRVGAVSVEFELSQDRGMPLRGIPRHALFSVRGHMPSPGPDSVGTDLSDGERLRAVFFTPFRWRGRDGMWDAVVGVIGSAPGGRTVGDPFAGVGAEMGYAAHEWPGVASFEWNAACALTPIMPADAAWDMSERDFLRVFLRTVFKAMDAANEGGGRVVETEDARAIVRFGRGDKPTRVHVAVWSRRGDLTQGFFVDGPDAETARDAAMALVEAWSPTKLLGPTPEERERIGRGER